MTTFRANWKDTCAEGSTEAAYTASNGCSSYMPKYADISTIPLNIINLVEKVFFVFTLFYRIWPKLKNQIMELLSRKTPSHCPKI